MTLVPTQHGTGHKCIMIHTPTPGVTLPRNTSKTHPNLHKNGSQAGPPYVLVQCVAMVPTNDTNVFRIPGPRQSRLLSKGEEYCIVTSLRRCCFCPTAGIESLNDIRQLVGIEFTILTVKSNTGGACTKPYHFMVRLLDILRFHLMINY